jgi:predicted ATPase/DNA-binding SARP family transcriptional activator
MDAQWRIELLGELQAHFGSCVIRRFKTQKTAALLAYLAYHHRHPHSRDSLLDLLWPDIDPDSARNSLRVALHSLRRDLDLPDALATPVLVIDRGTIRMHPTATTDVAEFEAILQAAAAAPSPAARAARLAEAIALYRGDLLPGHYEEWVLTAREHLSELYLGALQQRVAALEQVGDLEGALEVARRAVGADPLREEAHYDLMRLYAAMGQPSAMLRQYQELERVLKEELGEVPSAATRALAEELRGNARTVVVARIAQRAEAPPPPAALQAPGSRRQARQQRDLSLSQPGAWRLEPGAASGASPELPAAFTRFFGREEEIARVAETLCSPGTRLVTLTGPGGSGKTRLALVIAGRLREIFGGPIWFVPLADLTDPRRVLDAIADAMSLPRGADADRLAQVKAELERPRSLLVLDNLEHLLDEAAPLVQTLLEWALGLTFLVTSRQHLNLAGEQEFAILPLPTPRKTDRPERLLEYASVRLFVDRAQAVRSEFRLTEANAASVAALCDRLEGLPLAIELAAAWAQTLTPAQMLARLTDRSELLVSHRRDLSNRHRTLRAAAQWSFELLSSPLRRLFARLSVFRSGWTLEAAEAICGEASAASSTPSVLDALRQLRERSLVVVEEAGAEMRYRLLETLREYGAEQLDAEEQAELGRRHAVYYLGLAWQAEAERTGAAQREWMERLERERDNLRAAFAWSQGAGGEVTLGLQLGQALLWFWVTRGYLTEGQEHLVRLLAQPAEGSLPSDRAGGASPCARELAAARAKAQASAGLLALHLGDYDESQALSHASLSVGRALGEKAIIAPSLCNLGLVTQRQGDYAAARAFFEESLAVYGELGDPWGSTSVRCCLGEVALHESDYDLARAFYEEAMEAFQKLGDRHHIAWSLRSLGDLALHQGDDAAARQLHEEGLALFREQGDRLGTATSLNLLAHVAIHQGDYAAARCLCEESLQIWREANDKNGIAWSLLCLGTVFTFQGDLTAAEAFCREALGLHRERGDREGVAWALHSLGHVARERGDLAMARDRFGESLTLRRELRKKRGIAECLEGLAGIAAREQPERAAMLLGAAHALRDGLGAPLPLNERAEREEQLAALRRALGEAGFRTAWAAGCALSWEEAAEI